MTEFVAKKLGEVLAFAEVGLETFNKGRAAFDSVFGEEKITALINSLLSQKDAIHGIADRAKVLQVVLNKLEKTGDKLRAMRDLYVDDKWENATELLEWSGFFEGAALVHASLLQGSAEEIGHSELKSVADQSLNLHRQLLDEVTTLLHVAGRKKASS